MQVPDDCLQEVVPALATNADKTAAGLELELDAAVASWLNDTTVMLVLKTGQGVLVTLGYEAGVVRSLKASRMCYLTSINRL